MGCEIGTIKVALSLTCSERASGADSRDNANKQSNRTLMVSLMGQMHGSQCRSKIELEPTRPSYHHRISAKKRAVSALNVARPWVPPR
jgi:hypothetical protein